jgi:hypothetical protein
MAWNIEEHKVSDSYQEISVSILVKEMKEYQASLAETWINEFKFRLKQIKKTNIFSADAIYNAKPIDMVSLEVFKTKPDGSFAYKMFTVKKIKES